MINFEFSIPTEIKFGRDSHLATGTMISKLGRKALILYGSERIVKRGFLAQIEDFLLKENVSFVEYGGIKSNPSVETAREAVLICKRENVDCILAIGGGSVIDSAKAIAFGTQSGQDVWDIYSGKSLIPQKALPIGVILTIPATGSEANGVSVLSNYQLSDKRAISTSACVPKFAILNPEVTLTIPAYDTAVAAMDIFSHCFERYFDMRRGSRLWDSLCEATMKTIIDFTPKLLKDLKDYDLRSEIMWSATVAHSNMLGPGGDFGCHSLAHALTVKYGIAHGAALALIMPAWCSYLYDFSKEKFDVFGQNVWNVKDGEQAIKEMKNFIKLIGLPGNLLEAGVTEFSSDELAEQAFMHGEAYLGGGLKKISKSDAKAIYELL